MKKLPFVIIADSSLDLCKQDREKYQIESPILGKVIFPDGEAKDADVDWANIKADDFYTMLANKNNRFKTSLPNPYDITSRIDAYFANGQDVLAITLSSGMSGTYRSFQHAYEELKEKYPDRRMLIVDSKRYSAGVALLAVYASNIRSEGKSIDETFAWLENAKIGLHQMGILDDLYFLYRSGRIKKIAAVMGTLVGIKPMADFSNETGMPCVLGKSRGYRKSYKIIEKYVEATIGDPKDKIFAIVDSGRSEQAEEIRKIIVEKYHPATIISCRMGQSCAVNTGPGLAAVFYLGNPMSENCVDEAKIFQSILEK